jgi:hypothetical protein
LRHRRGSAGVKQETNRSHVMQFGDTSIASEEISNFQGTTDVAALLGKPMVPAVSRPARVTSSDLPSADAELASAYARFMATGSATAAAELTKGMRDRCVGAAVEPYTHLAWRGRWTEASA